MFLRLPKGALLMPDYLSVFTGGLISDIHNSHIAKEIASLNKLTEDYGLTLSQEDCREIAETRAEILSETERIEVGTGAVRKIIEEFCDSGYVSPQNYKDTIEGLLECFYTIKSETDDRADDETVIAFLKDVFENDAGGDVSKIYSSVAFDEFIAYFNR